jgi:hypothetical protein
LALFATGAQAGLTIYHTGDRASFDAATSITITETFTDVTPQNTALPSFTSQDVTYRGAGTGDNVYVTAYSFPNFGVAHPDAHVLTSNGNENFIIDLTGLNAPVTAVGFDTYINSSGPSHVGILTGATWTWEDVAHDSTQVGFFGITSTTPISQIQWIGTGGAVVNTGIDNVQIGVVPVPGAALLALLGFGAVGLKLRRLA